MFVDTFSSLDDIPYKKRGNAVVVLRALEKAERFSCFEVDSRLNAALQEIVRRRWADLMPGGYPWTGVRVTEVGRQVLRVADG